MLRTIFMVGIFALLGMLVLKFAFGIMGGLVGLLFKLLGMALWVLFIGAMVYLVIRIFSPDTARRLRERWSGSDI